MYDAYHAIKFCEYVKVTYSFLLKSKRRKGSKILKLRALMEIKCEDDERVF